jgi:hypothetical protein
MKIISEVTWMKAAEIGWITPAPARTIPARVAQAEGELHAGVLNVQRHHSEAIPPNYVM